LKKVVTKDSSISPVAGKVVYDETAHSYDVEDRERDQEGLRSSGAWSADTEVSEVGGPKKAWRDGLVGELQQRLGATGNDIPISSFVEVKSGGERGDDVSLLTADSRAPVNVDSEQRVDGTREDGMLSRCVRCLQ
jgi:hypothetical protein